MSDAEIWDDSALVNSWNEALEEYKHYHSLHARGEKVESLLQSPDFNVEQGSISTEAGSHAAAGKSLNDLGRTADKTEVRAREVHEYALEQDEGKGSSSNNESASGGTGAANGAPSLPQHLIGSVHDEGLKNLLMSWYYAGYYTGLYEGQQQVRQGQTERDIGQS